MDNPRPTTSKLLPRAKSMRRTPSDAEWKLWNVLRDRQLGGLKFRRQVPVGPYIADFICDECRLIVEIDGDKHAEAAAYDERRTTVLNELNWRVIRFTARDVVRDIDAVLRSLLRDSKPSP